MKYNPHPYQVKAIQHVTDNPHSALFLEVGLGKTSITLTALEELFSTLEVNKVLIVSPKRVCSHTWSSEIEKWDHLKHISYSKVIGTEKQRITALQARADIYLVSRDNVGWLIHYCQTTLKKWPFDTLVLDELSNFKNRSSMRFKAIRKIRPKLRRLIGLTGTPAPNKLLDLFGQLYLIDQGERLGKTFQTFKDTYFTPGARNGHIVFDYVLKKGADVLIHEKIKDVCLSMSAKDYLDIPPRIDIVESVELKSYERYAEFKRTEVLPLADGEEITPVNAAALYGKLLQYCNGAVYKSDGSYEVVDDSKLEALVEDVEALNGQPLLIFYQFKSDYERIKAVIPQSVKLETDDDINAWNRGEIAVALNQPMSIQYGINLQYGGHQLRWFGVGWDLETYIQGVGRLDRQNQEHSVINKRFIIKGSVEEVVLARLGNKGLTQEMLMEALKRHLY